MSDFWLLLQSGDFWLFHLINRVWTFEGLDQVAPYWRSGRIWFPAYAVLFCWLIYRFRVRALGWLLMLAVTITTSDQLSSFLIKFWFERVRPCSDGVNHLDARLLLEVCPSSFSFTSSHATNHFAFAAFFYMTLSQHLPIAARLIWWWAASVAYLQVYVGVHFPLDVTAGALLGTVVGLLWGRCTQRFWPLTSGSP